MKKQWMLVMFLLSALVGGFSQGIVFFKGTWDEALAKAKAEDKPIFVDAFTTWCGPCKVMSKSVFTDNRVGEVYNAGFINLKIDMEQPEGLRFQETYPVSAYPTLYYIASDGQVLKKVVGAQQIESFARIGQSVLANSGGASAAAEAYEKGDRSPEVVLKHIKGLNQSGKSSLKVANEYLRSQQDLTTAINRKIIFEAVQEADSRIFDLLVQDRQGIATLFPEPAVSERIYNACMKTADKALENRSGELLQEAKEKMKDHYPQRAKAFAFRMDMEKALLEKDVKAYAKALDLFAKNASGEPVALLRQTAQYAAKQHGSDAAVIGSAIVLSVLAAEKANTAGHYIDLAELYLRKGDKKNAAEAAAKAKSLSENEGPEEKQRVRDFLGKI
ncbi:MAG: thioredoxin family protein [Saprospiraceae bacterium]|jgi:thiol-disulfide isomerase/thioredoxin